MNQEAINTMRKNISALEDALKRLRHEVINLPFSDFRGTLLSYSEVALCWETVQDLKAIRETMNLALGMVDQGTKDQANYVGADLKERLEDVRDAIDRILVTLD